MKPPETKGFISHSGSSGRGRCRETLVHTEAISSKAAVAGYLLCGLMLKGMRLPPCEHAGDDPSSSAPQVEVHKSLPSKLGSKNKKDVKWRSNLGMTPSTSQRGTVYPGQLPRAGLGLNEGPLRHERDSVHKHQEQER